MKDFFEDYKRQKSDNEENARNVKVFDKGRFVDKEWRDLRVGNIIEVNIRIVDKLIIMCIRFRRMISYQPIFFCFGPAKQKELAS